MNIEREVTDIIIGIVVTYLSYIFVLSPTNNLFSSLGVGTGISILILVFLHLIFRQLGYFQEKESLIISYLCLAMTLLLFTFYLLADLSYFEGYWSTISSNGETLFSIINYLLFFVLGLAVYMSRDAT